jgi:hypothetical protein
MVEFGAGGKVARRDDPTGGEDAAAVDGAAGATGTAGTPAAGPAPQVAGGTTATGRERRKRKAKGWYCPVCRQPYTSLLRLALPSSNQPEAEEEQEYGEHQHSHSKAHSIRAGSIRSVRSTNTLRRAPSIAPTLPDGAERMLDRLRPAGAGHGDDYESDVEDVEADLQPVAFNERPQFVLGPEVDDDDSSKATDNKNKEKAEVQHRENAPLHNEGDLPAYDAAGRTSEEGRAKGWKAV